MHPTTEEIKRAYGRENYSILSPHITEDGWFHGDHIHDPVSTEGFESKILHPKVSGYSDYKWYRPLILGKYGLSLKFLNQDKL